MYRATLLLAVLVVAVSAGPYGHYNKQSGGSHSEQGDHHSHKEPAEQPKGVLVTEQHAPVEQSHGESTAQSSSQAFAKSSATQEHADHSQKSAHGVEGHHKGHSFGGYGHGRHGPGGYGPGGHGPAGHGPDGHGYAGHGVGGHGVGGHGFGGHDHGGHGYPGRY
ncbi:spidroin-2-like [Anopheles nili]|uniref:spidroin-2-like n=1 Tax=Anopheles nili TaxID=185578 RepID=UPI00237A92F2|nr:spidroin-2-like [Anopheles nili]